MCRSRIVTLVADRGKIRLILENLLSNAIKYSPRGGVIYLRALRQRRGADAGGGRFGPGHRRSRSARASSRRSTPAARPAATCAGTGIGLSVVNEFVNVHQGTVEIVDGEFPGAHFRIRMPLRVRDRRCRAKKQADAA